MKGMARFTRHAALVAVLGAALLALGSFALSFRALSEFAASIGLAADLAWIYPLIVDGFIVLATLTAVVMRWRRLRERVYVWGLLVVFGLISIAGNALHASHAEARSYDLVLSAAGSAVPPVALLLASHLLVMILDAEDLETPLETPRPRPLPRVVQVEREARPSRPLATMQRASLDAAPTPSPEPVETAPFALLDDDDRELVNADSADELEDGEVVDPDAADEGYDDAQVDVQDDTHDEASPFDLAPVTAPAAPLASARETAAQARVPAPTGDLDAATWLVERESAGESVAASEYAEAAGVSLRTAQRRLAAAKAQQEKEG